MWLIDLACYASGVGTRDSIEPGAHRLSRRDESRFFEGVDYSERFFMGTAEVHRALEKLTAALDDAGIPYAIAGAMALNQYGYRRTTVDVDVLLTREGLREFKARYLGRGYVEKFPGSKGLRDTENGVTIDVLIAGDYPGDGLPKPVAFPDPASVAVRGERTALLPIEKLVELKLASGMTAPHRLKDLADVLELIRAAGLPADFREALADYVRPKFDELWSAAQRADADE